MGDNQRIIRQWIETDAAFGAVEFPIPRRRRAARAASAPPAKGISPGLAPASYQPRPSAMELPAPRPAAPRPAVPPAFAPGQPSGEPPVAKARKITVEMPAAPTGNIAELPQVTREEKLARLATLQRETLALLTPLLNDVATKVVFGEGDADAPVLFIGEGPGIEEDRIGRPFVGKSGQMLDKWIASLGFKREQVFIANVVKLRAADWDEATNRLRDRPPTPEEVARSIHILHQQIEIIRPRVIVTLGAPAVKWVTGTTEGVMKLRGTWMAHRGVPLMPTYHPAFLLRAYTDDNRKKVWSDLQAVMAKLKA